MRQDLRKSMDRLRLPCSFSIRPAGIDNTAQQQCAAHQGNRIGDLLKDKERQQGYTNGLGNDDHRDRSRRQVAKGPVIGRVANQLGENGHEYHEQIGGGRIAKKTVSARQGHDDKKESHHQALTEPYVTALISYSSSCPLLSKVYITRRFLPAFQCREVFLWQP